MKHRSLGRTGRNVADLDPTTKLKLESILDMSGGYLLDFSNDAFADFVRSSLGFDPYARYAGELSKARLLRLLWATESMASVAKLNLDLLEYWRTSLQLANRTPSDTHEAIREELVEYFRAQVSGPVAITTEATVTNNKIHIVIHEDLYDHIGRYLETGDHFHAVEESYKLVRKKLREITGKEKATDAFAASNIEKIFGHLPVHDAERDFFEGVKFLHMSIQFLRNEKAHTTATPLEPNLALHYISLASLAYDMITRYVSEAVIAEVEELVLSKRRSYGSASAFYRDFEGGRWMRNLHLPRDMSSVAVRKVLKGKWLDEADFTRSWDHSNVVLMRLELVAGELTEGDIENLLNLPTRDAYDNDQLAGMLPFLTYIEEHYPESISPKVKRRIKEEE
jgi:uncharacterized protein (TIGR02391 family)